MLLLYLRPNQLELVQKKSVCDHTDDPQKFSNLCHFIYVLEHLFLEYSGAMDPDGWSADRGKT